MKCIVKCSWKLVKKDPAASCTMLLVVHSGSGMQLGALTLHCSCSSAGCKVLILLGELSRGLHCDGSPFR